MSAEPTNARPPVTSTRAELARSALVAYEQGDLATAASGFRAALARDPRDAELCVNLGVVLYEQGKLDDAFLVLWKALEVDPLHLEGLYAVGLLLYQMGRYAAAEAAFQRLCSLEPSRADAAEGLAEARARVRETADTLPPELAPLLRLLVGGAQAMAPREWSLPAPVVRCGKRAKQGGRYPDLSTGFREARQAFLFGRYLEAFDIYEQLLADYPAQAIEVLERAYEGYQELPDRDSRYHLYQARHFDFGIKPGDKVLDIGSGHLPFPLATHLGEFAIHDHTYGRAGLPFNHVDGKPVYECNVEDMPFADQEFDFVYCSHVLEHVTDPERACRELMRVARRGYIETPTRGKDLWLNTAGLSNHRWAVEWSRDTLVFTEYTASDIAGLQCGLLLDMHCAPQTARERALSALIHLKSDQLNTMLLWDSSFKFDVRRR